MSKSQRHTRSGAGRGVSQANKAAIYPKLTGLCQHEIVSGILKEWKQCGTVQASYGCLVGWGGGGSSGVSTPTKKKPPAFVYVFFVC